MVYSSRAVYSSTNDCQDNVEIRLNCGIDIVSLVLALYSGVHLMLLEEQKQQVGTATWVVIRVFFFHICILIYASKHFEGERCCEIL